MDYQKVLPATGAGVVIGSLAISEKWLLVGAVALVVLGAVLVRVVFRRGKGATDL